MSTITRATIAAKIRELFDDEKSYGQWRNGGNNRLTDSEYRRIAYNKAWEQLVLAYAWPGGYDLAYYPEHDGNLVGDVLCWECARTFIKANKDHGLHAEIVYEYGEEPGDHLCCDDCQGVIVETWREEAATEEDAPMFEEDAICAYYGNG